MTSGGGASTASDRPELPDMGRPRRDQSRTDHARRIAAHRKGLDAMLIT